MMIIALAVKQQEIEYSAMEGADMDKVYASLTVRAGLCVVHLCGCDKDIDPCCGMKKE